MAAIDDMTDQVRMLCGDPDTTEMPDATIQVHLNKFTLAWINKRRPTLTLTSFSTVAAQQDYDVVPATAYAVNKVYWLSGNYEFFTGALQRYYLHSLEGIDVSLAGLSVSNNPALVEAMYKALTEYDQNFGGDGMQMPDRKIRLVPYPVATGDAVYYDYWSPRWSSIVADDLLVEYEEAVEHYGAYKVLQALSIKRGMVRTARGVSGGGGANEKTIGDSYLEIAEAACPNAGAVFARG